MTPTDPTVGSRTNDVIAELARLLGKAAQTTAETPDALEGTNSALECLRGADTVRIVLNQHQLLESNGDAAYREGAQVCDDVAAVGRLLGAAPAFMDGAGQVWSALVRAMEDQAEGQN